MEYFDDWPGKSPDLNPMKDLWAVMKREIRGRDTSSLCKLETEIRDVWDNLKPELLQNLADSVPERLMEYIRKNGMPLKHKLVVGEYFLFYSSFPDLHNSNHHQLVCIKGRL